MRLALLLLAASCGGTRPLDQPAPPPEPSEWEAVQAQGAGDAAEPEGPTPDDAEAAPDGVEDTAAPSKDEEAATPETPPPAEPAPAAPAEGQPAEDSAP